jgi:hypothetical protein
MAFIEIARTGRTDAAPPSQAVAASFTSDAGVSVSFSRPAASEKLTPDWRGLADSALEANPFMAPEFVLPAAIHLARQDDLMLASAWKTHPRSRELIGLFLIHTQRARAFGWPQPRRTEVWSHPATPLGPLLLSRDAALAETAAGALIDALRAGRTARLAFPAIPAGGAVAEAIQSAAARRGVVLDATVDQPRSRGLDIMLTRAPASGPVVVAREPAALRAMLEQALAMDAATPRLPGDVSPALFAADELAFLRSVTRGFAQTGQIAMARLHDGPRKAAAVALLAPDRAYLWRLFGPSAHDPMAEAALACALRDATGLPVAAATAHPTAGFCTTPLRTRTLSLDLRAR